MKTCIAFLFFAIAVSAQNQQSIVFDAPISFGKTNIPEVALKSAHVSPTNQTVFVSDSYITGYCEKLQASGSAITAITYSDKIHAGARIDSFNANGAINAEEKVYKGVLDLIFND